MDKAANKPVSFERELEIQRPPKEFGIGISYKDWDNMSKRIEECVKEPPSDAFAWACIGFAGSSLLAAITFPFAVDFVRKVSTGTEANIMAILAQVVFVVLAISGFMQGFKSLQDRKEIMKTQKTLRDWILEDMEKYKQIFPERADKPQSEPSQKQI